MPKTQLPDDDPAKGNAAVPELDDEALTASDDDDAGQQAPPATVADERTTILDGEDTQPRQVNDDDQAAVPASERGEAGERGGGDLMQDEADTDGNV